MPAWVLCVSHPFNHSGPSNNCFIDGTLQWAVQISPPLLLLVPNFVKTGKLTYCSLLVPPHLFNSSIVTLAMTPPCQNSNCNTCTEFKDKTYWRPPLFSLPYDPLINANNKLTVKKELFAMGSMLCSSISRYISWFAGHWMFQRQSSLWFHYKEKVKETLFCWLSRIQQNLPKISHFW